MKSCATVAEMYGPQLAAEIARVAIALYSTLQSSFIRLCDISADLTTRHLLSPAAANEHAESVGLILADTKFEFGLLSSGSPPRTPSGEGATSSSHGTLILIDEVLTPDSSRYWSKAAYKAGGPQESFDKQFVRDWLVRENKKGVDGVTLPEDIVEKTAERYREAFETVTGAKL